MDDAVATTIATYERMAALRLLQNDSRLDTGEDAARVESFLLRTGRPVPRVIVMGGDLGTLCRQIDAGGGHPVGVDAAPSAVELARRQFPGSDYMTSDIREAKLERASFDCAWLSRLLSHFPRAEVARPIAAIHAALRPGGLAAVTLPVGEGEGYEQREAGKVWRSRWQVPEFEAVMGAHDFSLLSMSPAGDNAHLIFRREY